MSGTRTSTIFDSPAMLSINTEDDEDGRVLYVYRSTIVDESDDLYREEVTGRVDAVCSRVEHVEDVADPEMMFGRAELRLIRVWDSCPAGVAHDCTKGEA